jgi:predicted NBD/HSP70 family sugar kinase
VNDALQTASSPRRIRQRNEIAVLQALHHFGSLTRADQARRLRVNRSSSGHIIEALAGDGLVREVESAGRGTANRAGRPGVHLELVPDALGFVGIEIGVEHMGVVEIDLAANVVASEIRPFAGASSDVRVAASEAVRLVLDVVPPERLRRCEGVGVATPSQMDGQGRVRLAPLLGWREVDLADLVRAQLPVRVPVLADNDANAFAIGATYHGQEPPSGVTLFLVMESGVGGGIVFDGKLFRGGNGVAGEVGHLLVPDTDGEYRALERIVGLEVLLDRYCRLAGGNPLLPDLLSDVAAGKLAALGVARDWARALAFGLVQACRIIDPDRIVLGGSVAALYAPMAGHVVDAMAALQDSAFLLPEIVVTELEGSGPAFGAACMMHQRYLSLESQRLSEAADDDG